MKTLHHIPTDDPAAALQFCRTLAASLAPATLAPPIEVSVVLAAYNEAENLPEICSQLIGVLTNNAKDFEIIIVNDGSTDTSSSVIDQLCKAYPQIVGVHLARNFGQQSAFSAGLREARGLAVVLMDADLQDDPRELPRLLQAWRDGSDVAYAVRESRPEPPIKRLAYSIFYRLLRLMADVEIPVDSGDFCVMSRRIVDAVNAMPERTRFVRGMRSWVGYRQIGVPVARSARRSGEPKYTLKRLINLALDGLLSFSVAPLRAINILGISVSLLSIVMALFYFVKRILVGLNPPGFATTVVLISFLAGVQLITLGVIGEYIGRILNEVRQRPSYLIARVTRAAERAS